MPATTHPAGDAAQTHTTHCAFNRALTAKGAFCVQVVKQSFTVFGRSYDLQEIYGASKGAGEDDDDDNCVICLTEPKLAVCLPCRHMCLCEECAASLMTGTAKCPICRQECKSMYHVKIQRETSSN